MSAGRGGENRSRRLIFFVSEDWYFCSHRLPLAVAARREGYEVFVVTRVRSHGSEIEAAGIKLIPIEMSRRGKNPFTEAKLVCELVGIYRRIRPDVVHHVALKPVLYGAIAARLTQVPLVVNAMAGLGYFFSSDKPFARVLRPVFGRLLKIVLNHDRAVLILQNPDDVEVMCTKGTVERRRVRLIFGSGVDVEVYRHVPETDGVPLVILAGRMLWDKGVGEFVAAAKELSRGGVNARFALVGDNDPENPESVSAAQLRAWASAGHVEWWGHSSDMPLVFAKSHIVCLPTTYGEGVPKVLIEAASCGRPVIATDVPGCREIVLDGVNGILIPVDSVESLGLAIGTLLESPDLRKKMGGAGRELVKKKFSIEYVVSETLRVYESESA